LDVIVEGARLLEAKAKANADVNADRSTNKNANANKKPPEGGFLCLVAEPPDLLARDHNHNLSNHIGMQRYREWILAHRFQWTMWHTDLRLVHGEALLAQGF
jgi:hypothetical protein